jgi:hypothetical protein
VGAPRLPRAGRRLACAGARPARLRRLEPRPSAHGKQFWGELAKAPADASHGDGTGIRALADGYYGRNDDGTYDPGGDRYFTIGAIEENYPRAGLDQYLRAGKRYPDQAAGVVVQFLARRRSGAGLRAVADPRP